jgi:hypothetical protein
MHLRGSVREFLAAIARPHPRAACGAAAGGLDAAA